MATNENLIPIPGRLHSVAVEHHVAGADEIYDDNLNKTQQAFNTEVNTALGTGGNVDTKIANAVRAEATRATGAETALGNRVTSLETEVGSGGGSNTLSSRVTALENEVDTAAFLGANDGSAVIADFNAQSDTVWKKAQTLSTAQQEQVQQNIGIKDKLQKYDVAINTLNGSDVVIGTLPQSGETNKVYRVPNDPTANKYTDYGWNGTQFVALATYPNDVDDEPTAGSNNLITSGGVADLFLTDIPIETTWESGKIMNGSGYPVAMNGWSISDSFILNEGVTITGVFGETNSGYSVCAFFDEGAVQAFQRFAGTGEEQTFTVPRRCYVRLSVSDTANPTHSIFVPGLVDLKQLSDDVEYIKEHSGIKKSIWEGKKVGFLGDSTSASGTSTYIENYAALTGCLAQNYAIGGTSVADNGQSNPMCTRYSALPADLDMVLILGGVNDHRLGIPLGNFEDFNNDGSLNGTFYGALHTLIRGLKTKYLDKPIVYMTPMHNNYMDGTYGDTGEYNYNQLQLGKLVENKFPLNNGNIDETTATGGTLSEYILAIKKVCSFYGVPVIDLHDICGIQPIITANKTQYLPDGIHPTTQAGGKRMAEAVYPYLEQIYQ